MIATYPGGKGGSGVYQTLINQMPPHGIYIETHLGYGSVLRRKRPARRNIGIDLSLTALDAVIAAIVAANGVEASMSVAMSADTDTYGDSSCYQFVHGDCMAWMASYGWCGDEFVYADPPYLLETRRQGAIYDYEYDVSDHERLLTKLLALPCMVMISGYWSEMYADMLADWRAISFTTTDRGGNVREEWVWMNYPEPRRLHDYAWLGNDYRERERIKRKRSRWVRMLSEMPPLERAAIIDALKGVE